MTRKSKANTRKTANNSNRRELILTVLAGLPPFILGLFVYQQGFNMLDDGLWVLGGRVIHEGGTLYRDLFSIYGPARYLLLLPFFPLFGVSALSLAMLKCCCDGLAAAWAFRASRRLGAGHWAWLIPVGIMALGPFQPRYVALLGLTLLMTNTFKKSSRTNWLLLGFIWGCVALFGMDAAVYGTVIVVSTLMAGWFEKSWTRADALRLFGGLGVVFVASILLLIIQKSVGEAWWDLVVYPLTRFQDAMGIRWWDTFLHGPELGVPFAHYFTGETLPAIWSGHGAGVTLSIRVLFVSLGFVPPLALFIAWRRGQLLQWAPWVVLALTGWMTMAGRGGGLHLKVAWLGTLILAVGLMGTASRVLGSVNTRRIQRPLVLVFALLILGAGWSTFLHEKLWLASNFSRPGLVKWERPGARVMMGETRVSVTEKVFNTLTLGDGKPVASAEDPLLIWPVQPGLHVIMDRPLATAYATLLLDEVRDPSLVISQLETSTPPVAILGKTRGVVRGVRSMGELVPELWGWLREHYWILRETRLDNNEYKVCIFEPGGREKLLKMPLEYRLPDVETRVLNNILPLSSPGVSVGQSFRVGASGLAGIVVRFMFRGDGPLEIPVRLRLYGKSSPESSPDSFESFTRPLGQVTTTVQVARDMEKVEFIFQSLPETAGQDVLMTLEITDIPRLPVGIGAHLFKDNNEDDDLYPEGKAFVDGQPIAGDLYLLTY